MDIVCIYIDDSDTWTLCARSDIETGNSQIASGSGKEGEYSLPITGICWIWHFTKGVYHGLTVRDLGADRDLCSAKFSSEIKAASRVNGRRSNTLLPDEDRYLLRTELVDGNIPLDIVSGSVLDIGVVLPSKKSQVTIRDVERLLHMGCEQKPSVVHSYFIFQKAR